MRRPVLAALFASACGGDTSGALPPETFSGGDDTIFDDGVDAYSHPFPTLDREDERKFFRGRALFRDGWVIAPASTETRDGLGPIFNARSCVECHARDGRGRPPDPGQDMVSMLLRLSVPGRGPEGAPLPEPTYGGQMQPQGILGVAFEGRPTVSYREVEGSFADGETYSLRHPEYAFDELQFGPLAADARFSPRVAPGIIGLGLLEAVPEAELMALADPDDADGDGISGRINLVYDVEAGAPAVGRFGWKANQPTIEQQTAGAFNGDIGITSSLFPDEDCPEVQLDCHAAMSGGDPELLETILENVAFYTKSLAVPARRELDDPEVRIGERLFGEVGCTGCHVASLGNGAIRPYTDLLLHDLGEELGDGREDFDASGTEWRTPPLWGIGLSSVVSEHTLLLHDGRARSFAEAILWHGGEGSASRDAFTALSSSDRGALIRFLESL